LKFRGIRNVIFDLDGTLIDSSEGVVEATNYALGQLGEQPRKTSEITGYIGSPLKTMFEKFSQKSYEEFWRHFQKKGRKTIALSARPLDGAGEVLRVIYRRGLKIGIATTKIRVHIDGILSRMGWIDYIQDYVGADDVAQVKPHPEAFLKIMSLMGAKRENSVVVGDTINDVLAAQAAGLPIVAVRSPYGGETELKRSRPDLFLERLSELPSYLEEPHA